jgi:tetratricopeptide (TPR) repeat protein
LRLHSRLGDRHGQAAAWDSLGTARQRLGHHQRAVDCYHRAVALSADLGRWHEQAMTLARLGDAHHGAGDPDAARAAWRQALEIMERLGLAETGALHEKLRETRPLGIQESR